MNLFRRADLTYFLLFRPTVGTKITADPEKCFRELISEKLLIVIAGQALSGINYRFQ